MHRCASNSSNLSRRYRQYPGELERAASAPWQEVVVDRDINLYELMPLFRLNRGDGGYYLDKACTISRDPDDWDNDNVENAGIYRIQVKGPNRLGIQTVPQHDIALQLAHAEARAEDLPVAIAIGNEPLITLMGATPMLYDQLEYKMAALPHQCRCPGAGAEESPGRGRLDRRDHACTFKSCPLPRRGPPARSRLAGRSSPGSPGFPLTRLPGTMRPAGNAG
jgi:3-octaprenyl-4-hydroxybenzoate carboxy-lyase